MTTAINEAIQLAYDAMSDAFTDIGQWCQLAESQRELSPRPDYEPRCPSKSGIEVSRTLQRRLGNVMAEIRKHLSPHMGREDDHLPVDEAWLRSVGGHQMFTHDAALYLTKQIGYDCHETGIGTMNYVGWFAANSWQDESVDLGEIKTRGDVRKLCAALGITLSETETEKGAGE